MAMRPVTFKWKGRHERDIGFIAEEMARIDPLYVTYKDGRIEGVKYPQLTAVLVGAIKQLKAANDAQLDEMRHLRAQQTSEIAKLRIEEATKLRDIRAEIAALRHINTIRTAEN